MNVPCKAAHPDGTTRYVPHFHAKDDEPQPEVTKHCVDCYELHYNTKEELPKCDAHEGCHRCVHTDVCDNSKRRKT